MIVLPSLYCSIPLASRTLTAGLGPSVPQLRLHAWAAWCIVSGGGHSCYGRFSEYHVVNLPPDPGAANSCMHTCPEGNDGLTMVQHILLYLDMSFETLDLTLFELKSRDPTLTMWFTSSSLWWGRNDRRAEHGRHCRVASLVLANGCGCLVRRWNLATARNKRACKILWLTWRSLLVRMECPA